MGTEVPTTALSRRLQVAEHLDGMAAGLVIVCEDSIHLVAQRPACHMFKNRTTARSRWVHCSAGSTAPFTPFIQCIMRCDGRLLATWTCGRSLTNQQADVIERCTCTSVVRGQAAPLGALCRAPRLTGCGGGEQGWSCRRCMRGSQRTPAAGWLAVWAGRHVVR